MGKEQGHSASGDIRTYTAVVKAGSCPNVSKVERASDMSCLGRKGSQAASGEDPRWEKRERGTPPDPGGQREGETPPDPGKEGLRDQ